METKTKRRRKFDPKMYVKIHSLCLEGKSLTEVAHAIGVELSTLKEWRRMDEVVDYAIESAKRAKQDGGAVTFVERAFSTMPTDLQDRWRQLVLLQEEPNPEKRAEELLSGQGKKARQVLYVHALVHTGFRNLEACRMVGLSPYTASKWRQSDPDFLALMDHIHEMKKDFCEGALMGLVAQGDTSAVLFSNKTLNRDRGYDPKITVSHEGSVKHQVDISQLNLPAKVMEMILTAVKAAQSKQLEEQPRVKMLPAVQEVLKEEDEEAFGANY